MSNRISFIELDVKKCVNTYGVSPCTASIPTTGADKCYNCRATCQDLDNIDEEEQTARYSKPSSFIRYDLEATPNITISNVESISYSPPVLALGESIGVRASLSVSFKDHQSPDTDATGDPYIADRSYNPWDVGTYWGKFRARFPFIRGQALRWIQGTDDQLIENMETRHFIVDSVSGPNVQGAFSITSKDILKLTDSDQSVAPLASDQTTITTFGPTYTGIIDSIPDTDPIAQGDGLIAIAGSEIASYTTSVAGPGFTLITLTARGLLETEAYDNSSGDEISYQRVLTYDGESPADIFYDLLVNYANIDPSYISLGDWQLEATTYINRLYSTNIGTPTGVVTLINELIQQTASSMWWDNEAKLIRWQVLKAPATSATEYGDGLTISGSFNSSDDYTRRESRILIFIGQQNPLLPLSQENNYSTVVLRKETESEEDFQGVPAWRKLYSRWIPAQARDVAERLGDLRLQRFSTPPRTVGFRLLRDSGVEVPSLGGSYNASSFMLQDFSGQTGSIPIQITSLAPNNAMYTVRAEEITYNQVITPDDPNVFPISIDNNIENVNIRDLYDQVGPTPTASTVVNVTIASGVIVGSSSTSAPAITSGSWPAGVTVNLTNNGRIVGRGGNGGNGSSITTLIFGNIPRIDATNATNGTSGGDAIEDLHGINLTNNGIIGGGGGGGGGSSSTRCRLNDRSGGITPAYTLYWGYSAGAGGGGGAGSVSGSGGNSGSSSAPIVYSGSKAPIYTSPASALAGSVTLGAASVNGFSQNDTDALGVNFILNGAPSGSGGDLGQDGGDGYTSGSSVPVGGVYTEYAVGGIDSEGANGTGGAAGNAIVQIGATTNIITTGDIRGAIV